MAVAVLPGFPSLDNRRQKVMYHARVHVRALVFSIVFDSVLTHMFSMHWTAVARENSTDKDGDDSKPSKGRARAITRQYSADDDDDSTQTHVVKNFAGNARRRTLAGTVKARSVNQELYEIDDFHGVEALELQGAASSSFEPGRRGPPLRQAPRPATFEPDAGAQERVVPRARSHERLPTSTSTGAAGSTTNGVQLTPSKHALMQDGEVQSSDEEQPERSHAAAKTQREFHEDPYFSLAKGGW